MSTFYKRAWHVLFIIFYPFITLFSLLFIGLVSLISAISRLFAKPAASQEQGSATSQQGWQPVAQHHGLWLSRKAVHEVQFGPILYHYRSNPLLESLQDSYWSDFVVPIGEGFLLQRWPAIAEHELDAFELVYVRPGLEPPLVLQSMPTFFWQANELTHEQVEIIWQEAGQEKRLLVDEETLP